MAVLGLVVASGFLAAGAEVTLAVVWAAHCSGFAYHRAQASGCAGGLELCAQA